MTRKSPSAPDGASFEDAFERRLESLASTEMPDAELTRLPLGVRRALLRDDLSDAEVTDADLARIASHTRRDLRALRASHRVGATMLAGLRDAAANALAWCDELFAKLRPQATAVWDVDSIALVVEDEDGSEHELSCTVIGRPCRTSDGALRVELSAPTGELSGWQRAQAMVFLGSSPEPAEWRASYLAGPSHAEVVSGLARLTYDFPLGGKRQATGGVPTRPVSSTAIRQIRIFLLPV